MHDICESLGYSKSYLSSLFREQTGETIANYSVCVKIDISKQLIREGRLKFAQIPDKLSFDNHSIFHACSSELPECPQASLNILSIYKITYCGVFLPQYVWVYFILIGSSTSRDTGSPSTVISTSATAVYLPRGKAPICSHSQANVSLNLMFFSGAITIEFSSSSNF